MTIAPTVVRYLRVLFIYGGLFMLLAGCSNAAREASAKPEDGAPQPTTQTPPSLKSITLTPAALTLAKGLTQTFTATGNYSDGSTRDLTAGATWNASENTIATISNAGLATAAGLGTAKISAMVGGITGEATLTVAAAALIEISVTPPTLVMDKGTSQQFIATGKYTDGSTPNITAQATWSTSPDSVATVTPGGDVTAVNKGTSTISATVGNITGSTTLTVTDAVLKSISVTPSTPSVANGLTQQFTATGSYSDGTTQDLTTTVVWGSQPTAVATVSTGGRATATGVGRTTISATLNGITGSTTLTVTAAVLKSISVTPSASSLAKGLTQQFTATGTYTDATTQDLTSTAAWSSLTTTVTTISAGGFATAVGTGQTTINAAVNGVTGSTPLTVIPAVLKSISVTPSAPSLAKGLTLQFTATGTYTDATTQNLTSSAIWTSLTTTMATISAGGFATAVDLGPTTISALVNGITGSTTLTVMNSFTIGGTVSGLTAGASIVLQNNLADDLTASGNGVFTFSTPVADGAGYDVTVKTQPAQAGQHCNVLSSAGTAPGNILGITVTCAAAQFPRFSYVTNYGDNTISIYTVNASTGQLRTNGYVMASGINPISATVDPSGQFAYVANQGGNVSAYAINTRTGALTSIGPNLAAGASPQQVVVDPSGKFAYVLNSKSADVSAYTIDGNTGALTTIACANGATCNGVNFKAGGVTVTSASSITVVTVDPARIFAYVANASLGEVLAYTINATTGALTPIDANPNTVGVIENVKAGTYPEFVTVDPSGRFIYVANLSSNDISAYSININTGRLTQINCSAGGAAACNSANFKSGTQATTQPKFITFDPSGKFAYVANSTSNDVAAFTINASSGALARIGLPVAAGSSPYSVTVDPSGKFAYVANYYSRNVLTYRIDATTGALTPAGDMRARFGSTSFAVTKGPAPVTYTPNFAYVANFSPNTISTYPITANGSLTAVGTTEAAAVASPNSIAVDPSGKFAYAANNWSFNGIYSISTYTIATGVLTNTGAVNAVDQAMSPWDVVVDPSGRFVYVSSGDGIFPGNVAAYTINAGTGGLALVGTVAAATGTKPMSIDIDPTGRFIYAANYYSDDISAYSIDTMTGALTTIIANAAGGITNFTAGSNPSDVSVDPSGKFAYVTNSFSDDVWSYSIDATTGALTKLGAYSVAPSTDPAALAVDPSGRFAYVVHNPPNNLVVADLVAFDINPATGALSNRRSYSLGAGAAPGSVTVDASGKYVYVTNFGSNFVSAFTIDAITGSLTANGTVYKALSGPAFITTTATLQ